MQEDSNSTDLGWKHSGFADLMFKLSGRVTVATNVKPEINPVIITEYFILTLGLLFIMLIFQLILKLRIRPAHMLTNK
jgi:hypothetical protein